MKPYSENIALQEAQERYDAKTVRVNVRVSIAEHDEWERLASSAGLSRSGLLKFWIESGAVPKTSITKI